MQERKLIKLSIFTKWIHVKTLILDSILNCIESKINNIHIC